jgi:hypothetical protein
VRQRERALAKGRELRPADKSAARKETSDERGASKALKSQRNLLEPSGLINSQSCFRPVQGRRSRGKRKADKIWDEGTHTPRGTHMSPTAPSLRERSWVMTTECRAWARYVNTPTEMDSGEGGTAGRKSSPARCCAHLGEAKQARSHWGSGNAKSGRREGWREWALKANL